MVTVEAETSIPQPVYDMDHLDLKTLVNLWRKSGRNVPAFVDLFEKNTAEATQVEPKRTPMV